MFANLTYSVQICAMATTHYLDTIIQQTMTMLKKLGRPLLAVATIILCTIFGGSLFDLIVNEGNVTPQNYPDSVLLIRQYWATKNPGNFFRPLTPFFTVLFIVLLVTYWTNKSTRTKLLFAFLFFFIVQIITFTYYFPQNEIIRTGNVDKLNSIKDAYFGTRFYLDIIRNLFSLIACIFITAAAMDKNNCT